jgi:hypothetical protein
MELQAINQTISPSERNLRSNMLRKYVIIKLHNLKLDTGNAHIEPLQN